MRCVFVGSHVFCDSYLCEVEKWRNDDSQEARKEVTREWCV